ncbi:MAG: pyruvate dehydrogenase (acetyl-transferring), homodimeric type, partial [Gemmatimonadetes bacterium]|nr:pyruvate dehydrogenase (acetyl-transferring), homodimeric type [Gemmatimonadota bacterium]
MSNAQELQAEVSEWLESLDYVLAHRTPAQVLKLLQQLQTHAAEAGVGTPFSVNTPYINTIPRDQQPPYPGSREIERRIKSIVRWNAMAMVVRANHDSNLGGHIST